MRALIAFLACVLSVTGQRAITEDEAVARALSSSPDVLALREGVRAARARGSRLASLPSPELRAGISGVGAALDGEDDRRTNVGLRWSPPSPARLSAERGTAVLRVTEAEAEVQSAENRLAAEVRVLHRTIRLLDEQIRIAGESVETHLRLAAVVQEQVEARVKTVLDRSRCDGELARAKAAESRLAAERRVQLARFCHKTGIACSQGLMLSGGRELDASSDVTTDRVAVRRESVAGRPELASAAARSRIAAVAAVEERRERLPWVSFVQVTRLSPGSRWGLNVGVDLGLFGWRSGQVRAAEAEAARARLVERSVRRAVWAEVDELLLRLENVSRLLAEAQEEAKTLAGQVEFLTVQLGSGECDRTEPLAARIRLLDARREHVSLLMEYWALEAGLRQAMGRAGY